MTKSGSRTILDGRAHWLVASAVACTVLVASFHNDGRAAEAPAAAEIQHELRSFRVMAAVLHVGAHPDDENTQLIAWLAHGRAYRTAYLSVTRGDGGQNLLGPELGEKLGVARTQELLAARRIDGGRQFFTRAIDYGFSKDVNEALGAWDHRQVLGDVVRVIRVFRPDVIITRWSPQPGGTHGHHTASAVLALEAFKLAGDPTAYPEQLRGGALTPWQPKRIFVNSGGPGRGVPAVGRTAADSGGVIRMDIGGDDPVRGESFAMVASISRAMHKTQGFGQGDGFGGGGGAGGGGRGGGGGGARGGAGSATSRPESFQLLAGEPATTDILDGVDTTWNRVPGGAEIGRLANDVIARFNPQDPSASVAALLTVKRRLAALPRDIILDEKRRQLDRIIQECLGLTVETLVPQAELVPGEPLKMHHTAIVKSGVPVRWLGVRYPGDVRAAGAVIDLRPNAAASRDVVRTLPSRTPLTQPYWLREEGTAGMYRVDDPSLIGRPENPPSYPIGQLFEVGGQTLVIADEPVQIVTNASNGETRRRLDVIAPASLRFEPDVGVFAPGGTRTVTLGVTAARAGVSGTLRLAAPPEWQVAPASRPLVLRSVGDSARTTFTVTAPARAASTLITANAEINGAQFDNQRIEIRYDHIPVQLLQPPARLKAASFDLAIRGRNVGYVAGAGDFTAEALEQMGYTVTSLTGADLTADRLRDLDAVVFGIRAFNVRIDLAAQMPALFAYVEAGGTVVAQYNQASGLRTTPLAPFSLTLSAGRVTDEHAAVTFLAPDHRALNTPNKITSADFEGWVQERGLYYPNQWDERFTPILAMSDAGEAPLEGGLLVAQSGKGYFVYTGLSFFRQLPAGVPGAYRLFANLVSLGKK